MPPDEDAKSLLPSGAPHSLMEQISQAAQTGAAKGVASAVNDLGARMGMGTATLPNLAGDPVPNPQLGQTLAGNPNAAVTEMDLLTAVKFKLNRVATEWGIPYKELRDFFISHL